MEATEFAPGVYWVGVNDRTTDLFEGIWPLPHGVSYNAYLVRAERPVLIDSVKAPFSRALLENIRQVVDPARLAYLVVNHMEPDHSGALRALREAAPKAEILITPPGVPMLERFHGIEDRVRPVADGEELDLGDRALRFAHIPFVHWPETMATFDEATGVLFSCDAFGGFRALDGSLTDEDVNVSEYEDEILRYFSNIVGMHTRPVLKAIDKLEGLAIQTIAPSHGLVWKQDPEHIVDLYARWARMEGEVGITILYGSMYGRTLAMVEAAAAGVAAEGVPVELIDVARVHVSFVVREAWKRAGLLLACPTYDGGLFPRMDDALRLLERKRLRNRIVSILGSYGWHGGAVAKIEERAKALGWTVVGSLGFRGSPSREDLREGRELGRATARALSAHLGAGEETR